MILKDGEMMDILSKPEYAGLFEKTPGPICLLGFGGSYAYGTNNENSDIDIRGVYANTKDEILGIKDDSEQFVDDNTDTVIYSMRKMVKLLISCNPNVIEILGLRDEDYLYLNDIGRLLLDNRELFISKRAAKTFGGYAKSQLNRLVNKSVRATLQLAQNEKRSIDKVLNGVASRYSKYGSVSTYVRDDTVYFNVNMTDFPVTELSAFLNEINTVKNDYGRSERNEKAIEHGKPAKHMMHLIRLYMTAISLMDGDLRTYRDGAEHDLLMSIRRGDYLESDMKTPTKAFTELMTDYEAKFNEAVLKSKLPDEPDLNAINDLMIKINSMTLSL